MKAWKTVTLAGAVVALAAPAANASFDSMLRSKPHHAKKVTKVSHPRPNGGNMVIMIIAPPLPAGTVMPPYNQALDCENNGTNCTDQQLCDLWAVNCDLAAAEQQQAMATEAENPTG